MTTTNCPGTIPLGYAYAPNASSARVSLPVSRSQALYAHFEHVIGTPSQGGPAYSLDKLRILNAIIDRLSATPEGKAALAGRQAAPKDLDGAIEALGGKLHELALKSPEPYRSREPRPGALFSLAA